MIIGILGRHDMNKLLDDIVFKANMTIMNNQECYIAQWVLQNPDENISDWMLCHQPDWLGGDGYMKFWMERKEEKQI